MPFKTKKFSHPHQKPHKELFKRKYGFDFISNSSTRDEESNLDEDATSLIHNKFISSSA